MYGKQSLFSGETQCYRKNNCMQLLLTLIISGWYK